jgi:hypothetical protein
MEIIRHCCTLCSVVVAFPQVDEFGFIDHRFIVALISCRHNFKSIKKIFIVMDGKRLLFGCKNEVTADLLQGLFTNICWHLNRPNDIQNLAATKVYYATGTRRLTLSVISRFGISLRLLPGSNNSLLISVNLQYTVYCRYTGF